MSASSGPASDATGTSVDYERSASASSSDGAPYPSDETVLAADLIITHIQATHEAGRQDIGTLSQAMLMIMRNIEDIRESQAAATTELQSALTASLSELDQGAARTHEQLDALVSRGVSNFERLGERLEAFESQNISRFDSLGERVHALEARLASRLDAADSRSEVFEKCAADRFKQLATRIGAVETRFSAFEARMQSRFEADSEVLKQLGALVAVCIERISEIAAVICIPPGTCAGPQ